MHSAFANVNHRMPLAQHLAADDPADDQVVIARSMARGDAALQKRQGIGEHRAGVG